ncbi:hypothetical protein KCP78_03155 [Salmonella enterica subsp. enterica]|nr:hypothetical protein KCP78_03155 [Salmonella enterica subsp. enterica]
MARFARFRRCRSGSPVARWGCRVRKIRWRFCCPHAFKTRPSPPILMRWYWSSKSTSLAYTIT